MKTITNLTEPPANQEELELCVQYDTYIAQHDFKESFNPIYQAPGYRGDCIYEYLEWGNLKQSCDNIRDLYDLAEVSEKEARNALWSHANNSTYQYTARDFIEEYKQWGYKETLLDLLDEDFNFKQAVNEEVEIIDNLPSAKIKYHYFTTCGYSQGDYALVIVNKSLFEAMSGRIFNSKLVVELQETIHHLLWDAPIYARLNMGEKEIYLGEYLSDDYEWNREEVIDGLKKEDLPEYVKEFVSENLPYSPEYPGY